MIILHGDSFWVILYHAKLTIESNHHIEQPQSQEIALHKMPYIFFCFLTNTVAQKPFSLSIQL